jgi:hypothetical protein
MKRFVEGEDRRQGVLLPEFLDDWVSEENPVRAIDVFVDALGRQRALASCPTADLATVMAGKSDRHPGRYRSTGLGQ